MNAGLFERAPLAGPDGTPAAGPVRRRRALLLAAALLAAAPARPDAPAPWATPEEAQALKRELGAFLEGAGSRTPGSPGNLAMEDTLARLFAESGLTHGQMEFTAPAFLPGATRLTPPGGVPVPIHPLHPTLMRPGNFDERDFSAPLVYLGRATPADLEAVAGQPLSGALALLDFECGHDWLHLLRFGLKGFVFIAPAEYTTYDALGKVYSSETAVPRFLVEADAGARLKEAARKAPLAVRIEAEPSRWENRTLRNPWVLIPGSDPDLKDEVAILTAPLDSNSVAPGLAPGAQAGANLFLLTRLLEQYRRAPPARSVLLVAVNGRTQYYRGYRMLAWHLFARHVTMVHDGLIAERQRAELFVRHYGQLDLDRVRPEDEQRLIEWRSMVDSAAGKNVSIKQPLVTMAKRDVNRCKNEALSLYQAGLPAAELDTRLKALHARQAEHVNVLALFNKVGFKTVLSSLTPSELDVLRGYVRAILEENRTLIDLNQRDLDQALHNDQIRDLLRRYRIPFLLNLDLNWQSGSVAFAGGGGRWNARWGANTARLAAQLEPVSSSARTNLLADTLTMRGGLTESYYFMQFPAPLEVQDTLVQLFQVAGQVPLFHLRTPFGGYGRAFLPSDTVDQMPADALANGLRFAETLLTALLNDRGLTAPSELGPSEVRFKHQFATVQIKTYKFDELAAAVLPDIPVPNSMVTMRIGWAGSIIEPLIYDGFYGDVILADLALTDARATAFMYSCIQAMNRPVALTALTMDRDFVRVNHAIDAGDVYRKVQPAAFDTSWTLALFACRELPILATADPTLIADFPIVMDAMLPLTARGNTSPRKYGFSGIGGLTSLKLSAPTAGAPASFYFPPGQRIKLISSEKRLALNARSNAVEGIGFESPSDLGPDLIARMTRDMAVLNHARAAKLKVIVNELVHEFIRRGDACLARLDEALEKHDPLGYVNALYEGFGAHVKSYEQAKQTSDDMLQAVVVYMALLLPFCLFLEKLLFKFVRIEQEMAAFAVLFVLTFLVFRMIHPAFRMAHGTEAIFIAFIMGALGLFVISILRGRFEGTMQMIFHSYLGGDIGYSTVTQKAMMIGVNNMKRRRIRTMLTTATIVLVAFTMLSFTSVSKKVNPTLVTKSKTAPYTGFMYHWAGRYPMDESTLAALRQMFHGHGDVVVRRWLVANERLPFPLDGPGGTRTQLEGLLGIPAAEQGFLGPLPIVAGHAFSDDDAPEALLSSAAAALLAIHPNDLGRATVTLHGHILTVVGLFDDARFRALNDLNGLPLSPILRLVAESGDQLQTRKRPSSQAGGVRTADLEDMGSLYFADPAALLVVPLNTARRMGALPFSISLKMPDDAPVWPLADRLLTATRARFYLSSRVPFTPAGNEGRAAVAPGVYYIGSSYSTSVGGLAVLIIPLFIASTIILNTMLGSVYERKKEIAVFNAIGLNPHHIGTFFLAESFVYGVIGAVGGYLIGQVLSLLIAWTGWVGNLNFNYSSLSVAYVILFTIAIVLLSTLYPAIAATKAAVPSGKRTWSLPPHDGRVMPVRFPFIYQPRVAVGVLAYLSEYFDRFSEASIGDMIATGRRATRDADAAGRPRWTLYYHAALAPYDLGVTQEVVFVLAFDDHVQAYSLVMTLTRLSGQDSNWVTCNRPFLERLRKYLMRWRNLNAAQQDVYIRHADTEFNTDR